MINKNPVNRKKINQSKWTAITPIKKEKHFVVSEVSYNPDNEQIIDFIIITSVLSNSNYKLDIKDLEDKLKWSQGWN